MKIVATTSLPAVDRPNADRWNAARSRQNLGHRLKISSIGHYVAFHSIPLQSLPYFDVNNIAVGQKLTKLHNL